MSTGVAAGSCWGPSVRLLPNSGRLSETFEQALAHEQHITGCIHKLYGIAVAEADYPAQMELQWFIDEQVEEEENTGRVVDLLKLAGDNKSTLFMLDRELAQRAPETGGE